MDSHFAPIHCTVAIPHLPNSTPEILDRPKFQDPAKVPAIPGPRDAGGGIPWGRATRYDRQRREHNIIVNRNCPRKDLD